MKKLLLTLVTAVIASFAVAQIPVVTSMEELLAIEKGTQVEYRDLVPFVKEVDYGYYVSKEYFLPDQNTPLLCDNVYTGIAKYTVVGALSNEGFTVDSIVSVARFETVKGLLDFNYYGKNADILARSERISCGGSALITAIVGNYAFMMAGEGYESASFVMQVPDGAWINYEGCQIEGFDGVYHSSVYNEEYELEKGALYVMDASITYMPAVSYDNPISYVTAEDFSYVSAASPIRLAPGAVIVERDGAFYAQIPNPYEEGATQEMRISSLSVDLAQYKDAPTTVYLAGVYDVSVVNDYNSIIVTTTLDTKISCYNISEFVDKADHNEWEIPYSIEQPVLVTAMDAENGVLIVQDEYAAMVVDFGTEVEGVLDNIKVGDMIQGIAGLVQFVGWGTVPGICAYELDYTEGYDVNVFCEPVVLSSNNPITPMLTVTVEDIANEYESASMNGNVCKIAPKVVRLLDVKVYEEDGSYYMAQGESVIELSKKVWENIEFFERNNVEGIADFMLLNPNNVYQIYPYKVTDASKVPVVTTPEELKQYEGVPVVFNNMQVVAVGDNWMTEYFLTDMETRVIGVDFSSKMNATGIYQSGEFTILGINEMLGFASFQDLDNYSYVDAGALSNAYEIYGEMTVTNVSDDAVFIQYPSYNGFAGLAVVGLEGDYKIGDVITSIKGIYSPVSGDYDENWNMVVYRGAYFTATDNSLVKVVGSAAVKYGEKVSANNLEYNAYYYGGGAVKLVCNGGTVVKENDAYFYVEMVESYNGETDSYDMVEYRVPITSENLDLESYLTTEAINQIWLGVFDYKNTTETSFVVYVHATQDPYTYYENIAALLANDEVDYDAIATLKNPVTVTYVAVTSYDAKIFVQDETGAICVNYNYPSTVEKIKVGSHIVNLKGHASWDGGSAPRLNGAGDKDDYAIEISENGPAIDPREVTLAELNVEANAAMYDFITPKTYANNLVVVKNVVLTEGLDMYGEMWPCLVQGTDTLWVPKNFADVNEVEAGVAYDITGIVDWYLLNYSNLYTIAPRSTEDVRKAGIENVVVDANIYVANNVVYANDAVELSVYDINGRMVANVNADNVNVNGLANGVYVVRAIYADGAVAVAKVVR